MKISLILFTTLVPTISPTPIPADENQTAALMNNILGSAQSAMFKSSNGGPSGDGKDFLLGGLDMLKNTVGPLLANFVDDKTALGQIMSKLIKSN
jgi:hypothetical protein